MKELVEEMSTTISTYSMQVYTEDKKEEETSRNLWLGSLKTTKSGKVASTKLCQVGDYICQTNGWIDAVDSLSMYAYITKTQAHEVVVEENKKRDEYALES